MRERTRGEEARKKRHEGEEAQWRGGTSERRQEGEEAGRRGGRKERRQEGGEARGRGVHAVQQLHDCALYRAGLSPRVSSLLTCSPFARLPLGRKHRPLHDEHQHQTASTADSSISQCSRADSAEPHGRIYAPARAWRRWCGLLGSPVCDCGFRGDIRHSTQRTARI